MSSFSVKELKSMCKGMGIRGYSTLKKAQLIELLNQEHNTNVVVQPVIEPVVEQEDEDTECSICMCEIEDKVTTSCNHAFCKECIQTWCHNHSDCPMCRKNIKNEIIQHNIQSSIPVIHHPEPDYEMNRQVIESLVQYFEEESLIYRLSIIEQ